MQMTELGKQVWKKMEDIGWEDPPEGFYLEFYENIIECTKEALTIPVVVEQSKQFYCDERDKYGKTDYSQQCMLCVRDEQAQP